jgi:putative transposase
VPNPRKVSLVNNEIYHIFNRSVDGQTIFSSKWEFTRAIQTIDYYRFSNPPIRFSQYLKLDSETSSKLYRSISTCNPHRVKILSYCLMPNHYHFLLQQTIDNGISKFISDFSNSYSKYFNTKNHRLGPLFQGTFKNVRIETVEQLIHASRYIHINPVVSCLIPDVEILKYSWSSLKEYLNKKSSSICDTSIILSQFPDVESFLSFTKDRISYGKQLEIIKHLAFD